MSPEEYASCRRKTAIAAVAAILLSAAMIAIALLYKKAAVG